LKIPFSTQRRKGAEKTPRHTCIRHCFSSAALRLCVETGNIRTASSHYGSNVGNGAHASAINTRGHLLARHSADILPGALRAVWHARLSETMRIFYTGVNFGRWLDTDRTEARNAAMNIGFFLMLATNIIAIALISVVVIQGQTGGGLGAVFGGSDIYRSRRGIEKSIFQLSILLTVIFLVLCLVTVIVM
jgi:preprotein translocase subunit SecG